MVNEPDTSPVRPTAVAEPTDDSSSCTRKPAKVPDAVSKSNSPVSVSTAQVPSIPEAAAVVSVGPEAVVSVTWSTAASRETSSGASSRRNHQSPPPMTIATTTTPAMRTLARVDMAANARPRPWEFRARELWTG